MRKSLGGLNSNQNITNNIKIHEGYKEGHNEFERNSWFFKRRPRNSNGISNRVNIEGISQTRTIDNQGKTLNNEESNLSNVCQNSKPEDTSNLTTKVDTRPTSGGK